MQKIKITTIIFIILAFSGISYISAQNMGIQSVYMSPPEPTDQDIIYLFTELKIPVSGCWKTDQITTVNPLHIHNISDYCSGNYAAVCSTIDTIILQPLVAGNYIYHYVVNLGSYIDECETYEPYDSIDVAFNVINTTGIASNLEKKTIINLHYSKFENSLDIKIDKYVGEYTICISSMEGKVIKRIKSKISEQKINVELKSGIYLVTLVGNEILGTKKIFVSN